MRPIDCERQWDNGGSDDECERDSDRDNGTTESERDGATLARVRQRDTAEKAKDTVVGALREVELLLWLCGKSE